MKPNYAWKEAGVMQPASCTFDLTEGCNLACSYCFTWSKHKPRRITKPMAKHILNWWLPQCNPEEHIQIAWWGGEPLLEYKLMQELILYVEELGDKLGIKRLDFGGTTNGTLYTPDKVEWLNEHNSLFLISLDGIEPMHNECRKFKNGKGSWKTVVKNTKAAIEVAGRQRVRMSFAPTNVQYFFESIQFFVEELGIDNCAFSPVYEGDWNEKALETLRDQYKKTVDYAAKRAKEGRPIVLKHFNDEALIMEIGKMEPQNPCGAGSKYTGWSVDGFMFPCHRFNKHGITSAERAKLPTIIARPKGKSFEYCNVEWRNHNFTDYHKHPAENCAKCNLYLKASCKGGCYAVNYDMTGSMFKQPKALCDISMILKEAGEYYAKIAHEESFEIMETGWGDGIRKPVGSGNCVCYNLCYMEGTSDEIIHIDRKNDKGCICYFTNYSGPQDPQVRKISDLDQEQQTIKEALVIAVKMLETKDEEKTEEQIKAEKNFLESAKKILWRREDLAFKK